MFLALAALFSFSMIGIAVVLYGHPDVQGAPGSGAVIVLLAVGAAGLLSLLAFALLWIILFERWHSPRASEAHSHARQE